MSIALAAMPKIEKGIHIFWLLGPFIFLIERSPADLWITCISLTFLIRSFIIKDFQWLNIFWIKAAIAFWLCSMLSSILSPLPLVAMAETLVWIRFPMFAAACAFWLAKDTRLIYAMLISTLLGVLVMCGILTLEILIEGQKNGRLMWPYGDLVPGNYVAKVGMPIFTIMVAVAVSVKGKIAAFSGLFALVTMVISVLTGERINFLIRACGGVLAALVWKPKWNRLFLLLIVEILAVVIVFQAAPQIGNRYVDNFIRDLPTGDHSAYYRTMMPGVLAFKENLLLGVGTGNMRYLCEEFTANNLRLECHPHPHNFYIQLAAENGILGLIVGTIFLWSIVWTCFSSSLKNRDNVVVATCWVIPFGLFWPIASFPDFFGQWNNCFMWSAIALAIASARNIGPKKARSIA